MFTDPQAAAQAGSVWITYATKLGVPSVVVVIGTYFASKILPGWLDSLKTRLSMGQQKTALESAGIGGANDVVNLLRNQIADYRQQLVDQTQKLKDMETTLNQYQAATQQAQLEKQQAVRDMQQAQSDIYSATLHIQRLKAQVVDLKGTPTE